MANLRIRPPTKHKDIIGRFIPHGRCKNHPKHHQSPGVCSLCLRHKLSQLSSSSSLRKTTSSSASSSFSSYYSSSASSSASPIIPFPFHKDSNAASSNNNSVSIFLFSTEHGGVLKSRSMSVVATRRRIKDGADRNNKSAKKSGFWSKLLHPKTKRIDED